MILAQMLVYGLGLGLVLGPVVGLSAGLVFGIINFVAISAGRWWEAPIMPRWMTRLTHRNATHNLAFGLLSGSAAGLLAGVPTGFVFGLPAGLASQGNGKIILCDRLVTLDDQ
jgi:membrane-bound metal-dependent hydrolase YbcI (DUF457 family)